MDIKRLVATATAALVLALAASAASATKLSISNQRFRIVWDPLTFTDFTTFEVRCDVTLEGSFHRTTFTKTAWSLIGLATRVRVDNENCISENEEEHIYALNGDDEIDGIPTMNRMPWHVAYQRFSGALPSITGVEVAIVGASFLLERIAGAINCLYRGEDSAQWYGIAALNAEGRITSFRSNERTGGIPKISGGILCVPWMTLEGTGGYTLLGSTTTVSIRLI